MNNEEKAIEIARKHHAYCFSDAVSGAIDMAEWKDQQLPTYEQVVKLEKLIRDFYIINEQWVDCVYQHEELTTDEMFDEVQRAKYEFLKSKWEGIK